MTRKADKTTTEWRRRYIVRHDGRVYLVRGTGKKCGKEVLHQVLLYGKWRWTPVYSGWLVETEAQLAALRLQGTPVAKEPRWTTYSS